MARSEDLKTPEARFAFTRELFTAKAGSDEPGAKKKFGCTLLFPKSADLSALKDAAVKAATEEWGDKAVQWIKDGVIKSPFLDGDGPQGIAKKTGERKEGHVGHTFIRVTSGETMKPVVVDRLRNPVVDAAGCPSGCYGFAVVNAFTWDNPKNGKGITFGISMAQVTRPGEALGGGGGPDPDKFFEKIADEGAAPEATKSGQGAGGLFG